jgi:quercetin dioxygenase-like cupin family protein
MRLRVLSLVLISGLLVCGSLPAGDLTSGPQIGDRIPGPFNPLIVVDAEKPDRSGTRCDPVERHGSSPVVLVFARTVSEPVTKLVKRLDAELAKHKQDGAKRLYAYMVMLSDDESLEMRLKDFAKKHRIKNTSLAIDWNVSGPSGWKLGRDADVTIILYSRGKVEANHAFRKGELNEKRIDTVLADLPKLFGKTASQTDRTLKRSRHSEAVAIAEEDDAKSPPKHPDELETDGLMVKRSEIVSKKPTSDLGVARIWTVEKGKQVQCLFVEVSGMIPMHFHPDGIHRMYVIEGKIRMTIGKETMDMEPGDFMLIPRGVRHKAERVGDGKAYFATVDTPPIDPKKIVWLEPPPKK